MFPLADYHTLALSLDLNKLLVPTKPRRSDFADGIEGEEEYITKLEDWRNMSPISGIFKSFSDAPCVPDITTRMNSKATGSISVWAQAFR